MFAQRFMESPRAKHRILTEGNIWGKIISISLKTIEERDHRLFLRSQEQQLSGGMKFSLSATTSLL